MERKRSTVSTVCVFVLFCAGCFPCEAESRKIAHSYQL